MINLPPPPPNSPDFVAGRPLRADSRPNSCEKRGRKLLEMSTSTVRVPSGFLQNSSPSTPRSASVTRLPRVLFLGAGGGGGAGTSPRSCQAWYSGFITCASHHSLSPQDMREGRVGPGAHLHGEHDAVAVAVVLDRVEVRVVEDNDLALLPRHRLAADRDRHAARHVKPEVHHPAEVPLAAVRPQLHPRLQPQELRRDDRDAAAAQAEPNQAVVRNFESGKAG